MHRLLRSTALAVLAVVTGAATPTACEPLVVVVSDDWERASAIELRDLRAVYLGSRTRLFGRRVYRVDLPSGGASREGFSRSVLGRPEAELERYWIEQALSGGALPPRQLATPEEVIATVAGRVGTHGYVPVSALELPEAEGVRSLRVIVDGVGLPPSHADYPARSRD
jgi:hypothetical protein